MKRRFGSRLPLLLAPAVLLVAACGVPISAEEITATAESQRTSQQLSAIGDAVVSAKASEVSAPDINRLSSTPAPVSTLGGLSTPSPSVTPNGSATPAASVTGTPSPSTTPNASALAATETTGTATPEVTGTPGTPTVTPTASPQPTAGVPTNDFGAQVVNLVNDYRVANGLSRLKPDPYITTASNNYAKDMAVGNFFGHTGKDGSTSEQRIYAAGFPGCFWGEAIAAGQPSPQEALTVWKNSPPHNKILLDPQAVSIGAGYYYNGDSYYKSYWVLMTGRPEAGCIFP
ncbi:MAG: CAP domain-containing protein [Dehalococcoidia bacterium]